MSEWNSIEDRLPAYNERVLLWVYDQSAINVGHRTRTDSSGEHWSVSCEDLITHWMCIPDPPKKP